MAKPVTCRLVRLVVMSVLGCASLLGACGQGQRERADPVPEVGLKQPQGQLNNQDALEQGRRAAALQQAAQQRGWRDGHNATVACLHGERAQTDGNELRCEDQAYVDKNYRQTNHR